MGLKTFFDTIVMKKLLFLFLVYDDIEHEELWNEFFRDADLDKYDIRIHQKNSKDLKYFNEYRMPNHIPTRYADISLVKAQNLMIEDALLDPDAYKFIFLSQHCIPLKSFNYIYTELISNNASIFNEAVDGQCFPRCVSLLKHYPASQIKKASQWCILNREHAQLMIDHKNEVEHFSAVTAPEEIYYLTMIMRYGNTSFQKLIRTSNLASGATTFTNWENMKEYPYVIDEGLKTYKDISVEELKYLLKAPCLFGRKFDRSCVLSFPLKDAIRFYQ